MKWAIGMKTTVITSELKSGNKKKRRNMTIKEHINTLKDPSPGLVFAYIACVSKAGIDIGNLDIENDEYEDVKAEVDELIEQAYYCSIADFPILTERDTWRYFENCYWEYHGDNGEYIKLIEHKRPWMKSPWKKFRQMVERNVEAINKKNNSNDALYECNGYYFII